jgi:CRISPR-associated protein Csm3
MEYSDFDKFFCQYSLVIELTNETPLSISSGKTGFGSTDNPIIRVNNMPYIPGSSIKGVLRSETERYARTTIGDNAVCNILDPQDEKERQEKLGKQYEPCVICSIFGGPTISSHIFFSNAPLVYNSRVSVVRHVSLDRRTGAGFPSKLYDVEQIDKGAHFTLTVQLDNLEILSNDESDKRIALVIYAISRLLSGIFLGGRKSIGNGLVRGSLKEAHRYSISNNKIIQEDALDKLSRILGG